MWIFSIFPHTHIRGFGRGRALGHRWTRWNTGTSETTKLGYLASSFFTTPSPNPVCCKQKENYQQWNMPFSGMKTQSEMDSRSSQVLGNYNQILGLSRYSRMLSFHKFVIITRKAQIKTMRKFKFKYWMWYVNIPIKTWIQEQIRRHQKFRQIFPGTMGYCSTPKWSTRQCIDEPRLRVWAPPNHGQIQEGESRIEVLDGDAWKLVWGLYDKQWAWVFGCWNKT